MKRNITPVKKPDNFIIISLPVKSQINNTVKEDNVIYRRLIIYVIVLPGIDIFRNISTFPLYHMLHNKLLDFSIIILNVKTYLFLIKLDFPFQEMIYY